MIWFSICFVCLRRGRPFRVAAKWSKCIFFLISFQWVQREVCCFCPRNFSYFYLFFDRHYFLQCWFKFWTRFWLVMYVCDIGPKKNTLKHLYAVDFCSRNVIILIKTNDLFLNQDQFRQSKIQSVISFSLYFLNT